MISQQFPRQPIGNAEILLPAHGPLCINGILFFVDIRGIEKRVGEETGKTIQGLGKDVVFDEHHVVGNVQSGIRIGHPAMFRGEGHKTVWLGVLGGPHKEHVFQIMRHPGIVPRIRSSTQTNTECSS